MTNVFIKPSGKLKGSQTMGAKNDSNKPVSVPNKSKVKIMAKVMKAYPQGQAPMASKVVAANQTARSTGPALSEKSSKRNMKYIGA